jgi:sugar/nucleoside kinase (ribokinase family)
MKKILLIGSVCADVMLYVDHLPAKEEDVNVRKMEMRAGGCACNAAAALQKEAVPFDLVYPLGTGLYGEAVRKMMKEKGWPAWYESKEQNGACFCLIDGEGNRTFLAVHGAEYHFPEEMFAKIDLKEYGMAYISGIDLEENQDVLMAEVSLIRQYQIPLVYAVGPRPEKIPSSLQEKILQAGVIVHCSRPEAERLEAHLQGKGDPLVFLHGLTRQAVIISDGAEPVRFCDEAGKTGSVPCEKVKQVNGTGAGDRHIGTIMACLMKKMKLADAIDIANRNSAMLITEQE